MPDSTNVLQVLFPRTDFPQDGWISGPLPFDPLDGAGIWSAQAGSFRSRERLKHAQWLAQPLGGGAALLDATKTHPAYLQLFSSFRSEPMRRDLLLLLTEPQAAWIFQNLPSFDPANFPWPVHGERTQERQKLSLARQQWFPSEASWVFENLPAPPVVPEGIASVLAQMGLQVSFTRRSVLDVRADLWVPEFGWITVYVPMGVEGTKFYTTVGTMKAMGRRRR